MIELQVFLVIGINPELYDQSGKQPSLAFLLVAIVQAYLPPYATLLEANG